MADMTPGLREFNQKHAALRECQSNAEEARAQALSDEARAEEWGFVQRALEVMGGKRRARSIRDKILTYERALHAAASLRLDSLAVERAVAAERLHSAHLYMNLMTPSRQGARWEDWEDDLLVLNAASWEGVDPHYGVASLAGSLGRTPGAISSRLSHLVGMRRVSQEVSGRLEGFLNGLPIDGAISGTLHRIQTTETNQGRHESPESA